VLLAQFDDSFFGIINIATLNPCGESDKLIVHFSFFLSWLSEAKIKRAKRSFASKYIKFLFLTRSFASRFLLRFAQPFLAKFK